MICTGVVSSASDLKRVFAERARMDQSPSSLDSMRREAVLASLLDHCSHRNSTVFAAQAGSSHVHIVVESEARLERIMNDLKSYASRCLNRIGLDPPARKRWARQHPVVICGKHVGQRSGTW
jgi:REP element-mobilizing transposase RayT